MENEVIHAGLSSLRARARVAMIAIYVVIAFNVVRAAVSLADLFGLIALQALPSQAYVDAFQVLEFGSLAAFYASAIAISFWIYRAHKNLFDAGYGGLEFSPGWSIGWFFVPIASLYMPYKAMREAWNVSLVGKVDGASQGRPLLAVWWSSYLVGNIADLITAATGGFEFISRVAMIISAWSLGVIIRRITAGQDIAQRLSQTFA